MAYERGLLTGPNLNILQEKVLMLIMLKQQKREFDKEEVAFEQMLLIHRPELYEKFREFKEDNEKNGYDAVVWGAPETPEEAEELLEAFASIQAAAQQFKHEEPTGEYSEQLALLEQLEGIDISLLGDDDG